MAASNNKQIVTYSPFNPSVLFHRMRTGLHGKWDQNRMVASVRRWLRPPRKKTASNRRLNQAKTPPCLIIPDAHDPFMLLAKSDPMSSLLAENQRLRNLINDLVREDRRTKSLHMNH